MKFADLHPWCSHCIDTMVFSIKAMLPKPGRLDFRCMIAQRLVSKRRKQAGCILNFPTGTEIMLPGKL